MLILTRYPGESIMVGDDIQVVIDSVRGDRVSVGITAPKSVNIARCELYDPPPPKPLDHATSSLPNVVTLACEHAERYADDNWQRTSIESFLAGFAACQQFMEKRQSQLLRDIARGVELVGRQDEEQG